MKKLIYLITLKPSSHRTAEENLGIQYLASVLISNGYVVKIRDSWLDNSIETDDIYNEIISDKEKVLFVGTSSYMLNNKCTCELIKKLKRENINVACGGYGPTFEPEIFLDSGADMVMFGEGEITIVEAAKYFETKQGIEKIDGICYYDDSHNLIETQKRTVTPNLDDLPFPQRPYLDIVKKRHSTVNVLTARGCNGVCQFCSISAFLSKQKSCRWRGRSLDSIISELKELKEKNCTTIKFVDDSFIENERDENWCKEFYNKIKENNLSFQFRASLRADKVTKLNMKYLRKAGFFSFSCGIENGSKTALKRMAKLASVDDNKRALKIFKKNKLYIQAGFILFDDKTTIQELKENYKFLNRYKWVVSKGIFSEMYAAVGTQFTKNSHLESDNKYNSNNLYLVKNEDSRQVYNYLKKWQSIHSNVYDMVIDPISAPKDIPLREMKKYYKLMIKMKIIDLKFMKDVINGVENKRDLDKLYESYKKKYDGVFAVIKEKAERFYASDNLNYDANINGFLKTNIQNTKELDSSNE